MEFFHGPNPFNTTFLESFKAQRETPQFMALQRAMDRFPIHPAIVSAVAVGDRLKLHRDDEFPSWFGKMIQEWPHVSEVDPSQIAWADSLAKMDAGRWTRGRVGRYIQRITGYAPHIVEMIVADAGRGSTDRLEILETVEDIATAYVEIDGISSCMRGASLGISSWERHPARVYDPAYGWKLAVLNRGGNRVGRALINDDTWVRIYAPTGSDDYAVFESLLSSHGFRRGSSFDGCRIKTIRKNGKLVCPYIDGSDVAEDYGNYLTLGNGYIGVKETNGYANEEEEDDEDYVTTESGDRIHVDDSAYIDGYGYVHQDDACYAWREYQGRWTQETLLADDCVQLGRKSEHYGEWCEAEDAVETDFDGWLRKDEYAETYDGCVYHMDDTVYLDMGRHGGECAHHSEVTRLASGEYVLDDETVEDYAGNVQLADDCRIMANGDWILISESVIDHKGNAIPKDEAHRFGPGPYDWAHESECVETITGALALPALCASILGTFVLLSDLAPSAWAIRSSWGA